MLPYINLELRRPRGGDVSPDASSLAQEEAAVLNVYEQQSSSSSGPSLRRCKTSVDLDLSARGWSQDDGAAAADLSLYADDASDDADDWPVRSSSPAVERPATAGVSVSLEDEPSPPFATPREPYEPAAFARAAVDLSTPLKPPAAGVAARTCSDPVFAVLFVVHLLGVGGPRLALLGQRFHLSTENWGGNT